MSMATASSIPSVSNPAAFFELPWLRKAVYLTFALNFAMKYALDQVQGTNTAAAQWAHYLLPLAMLWIPLLAVAVYYAHLALRRFRLGVGGILALGALGVLAAGVAWIFTGWEGGVTVAIAAVAGLCFAWCWSASIARLLGWEPFAGRTLLFLLGLGMPLAIPGLVLGAIALVLGIPFQSETLPGIGASMIGASIPVLLAAGYFSFRARRAARKLLESMSAPTETAPAPSA